MIVQSTQDMMSKTKPKKPETNDSDNEEEGGHCSFNAL